MGSPLQQPACQVLVPVWWDLSDADVLSAVICHRAASLLQPTGFSRSRVRILIVDVVIIIIIIIIVFVIIIARHLALVPSSHSRVV